MDYKLILSKRRTMSLVVTADAEIVVRASPRHPKFLIDSFVRKHQEWIRKALAHQAGKTKKQFAEGELFLYLGKEYPLRVLESYRSRLVFDSAFYISKLKLHQAKKLFQQWYRDQAGQIINERTHHYVGLMGLAYKKITIRDTSSRWGSCSSLGNLNFSFRLILAPLEILDYVVIHELAHLTHKNHSQKFWDMVGRWYPDHRAARKWLRVNGPALHS